MEPLTAVALLGFIVLVGFFLCRLPIAFSMALVGFVGFSYVVSPQAALSMMSIDLWSTFSNADLIVIPMFVFMGSIAFYSGISSGLFEATNKFMGRGKGGLAMATITAGAFFACVCGSSIASAATLGKVAIPEMKKYNYAPSLSAASSAAGGVLGILIPPSTTFIIYGMMTGQSIGKLFISGIIPGVLLALSYLVTIYILCKIDPSIAPEGAAATWRQKMVALSGVLPVLILFALVMGGLFAGWFTATEAGAAGAGGSLVIALARRTINWEGIKNSLEDTVLVSCMIFVIVAGATIFGKFIAVTQLPFRLATGATTMNSAPWVVIGIIIVGYLIAGCFMDSLALITLTIPIIYPVVMKLGYDPILFGVVIVLMTEAGVLTPPVGANCYVVHGIAPEVPLDVIFRGVLPFVIGIVVICILILFFPQLALYLPSVVD